MFWLFFRSLCLGASTDNQEKILYRNIPPSFLLCLHGSHREVPRFGSLRSRGRCHREKSGNCVLQHLTPERVVPHARAGPPCPLVPGLEDLERPEPEEGRCQPGHDLAEDVHAAPWGGDAGAHRSFLHHVATDRPSCCWDTFQKDRGAFCYKSHRSENHAMQPIMNLLLPMLAPVSHSLCKTRLV